MIWDDSKFVAFDLETSGTLPEYALQPWRVAQGTSWTTSMSLVYHNGTKLVADGQLFPKVEVTLATADALLIAEYCRRKQTGTL